MNLLSHYLESARLKKTLPYVKGSVLDLGCGPSPYLGIRNNIKKYYGVDMNPKLVAHLKFKYPSSNFFKKNLDIDSLNFGTKFDVVLMVAFIEHIYNQKHLFTQVLKNLNSRGRIVITTPTPFGNDFVHRIGTAIGIFSRDAADNHVVIYNKKRFKILARDFGLVIEKYHLFEFGCNQLVVMRKK